MRSSRPYLLRALHEWIVDSGLTPHLLVSAEHPGVEVPPSSIHDGRVVLNVSPSAVRDLLMDNESVSFVARFGGISHAVYVPVEAVQAVYARENGRGMMFPEDEEGETGAAGSDKAGADDGKDLPDRKSRPNLKVIK